MWNKIFVMNDFKFDLQRFDSAFGGGDEQTISNLTIKDGVAALIRLR